jgi:hypothetical protein
MKLRGAVNALKDYPPEVKQELQMPLMAALLKDMQANNPGLGQPQQQQQQQTSALAQIAQPQQPMQPQQAGLGSFLRPQSPMIRSRTV